MEQQSRSNTNVTHQIATHLTSSIKPAHALGLLTLNPGPPSTCPSPFSTPSVAESVEFTETNPKGIDAIEQQAPDTVMNDTESESEKEETPAGAALSVPLKQVILKQVIFSIPIIFDRYRKHNFSKICTRLKAGQGWYKISKRRLLVVFDLLRRPKRVFSIFQIRKDVFW